MKSAYNFSNLESFLKIFYQGSKVLVKEQDFFDLTWAYVLKCKADNVVHTEIFFDPQTHVDRGINFDTVINGIYEALQKANKEFGLTFKIVMCFLRHLDEKAGFEMLDQKLMVMVNSDDPAYFGGYINKNLIECQTALNLSMNEVKTLLINSFKSSFLKEEEKRKWISKI